MTEWNFLFYKSGWKFTKLLNLICKIFCNFLMLLQHNYSWEIVNLWLLQYCPFPLKTRASKKSQLRKTLSKFFNFGGLLQIENKITFFKTINIPWQRIFYNIFKKNFFIYSNRHLKLCLFHFICSQPPYVLMVGGVIKNLVQTFSGNKHPFRATIKLLVGTDWLLSEHSNL